MKPKAIYENQEDIPENLTDLYSERDGQWELTGIEGVKTQADIDRVQVGLDKERKAHKETKSRNSKWQPIIDLNREPDEILGDLDRIDEYKASAEGKLDNDKIDSIVETRIKSRLAPIERENKNLKSVNENLQKENENHIASNKKRTIVDAIRKTATSQKVLPEAMEDVVSIALNNFELTEDNQILANEASGCQGISLDVWFTDQQTKRPYLWPSSQGGGAGGSNTTKGHNSKNPWSAEHWNFTEQNVIFRDKGKDHADQLAKIAGTTVGGPKPTPSKK